MNLVIALDTSVLLAGLLEQHAAHATAVPWLERGRRGEVRLVIAAHALAECYATLTSRAPGLAWPPREVMPALDDLRTYVHVEELTASDYGEAISLVAQEGLISGVVYDALHYAAAVKARARHLLTRNLRDFHPLCTTPGFVLLPEAVIMI